MWILVHAISGPFMVKLYGLIFFILALSPAGDRKQEAPPSLARGDALQSAKATCLDSQYQDGVNILLGLSGAPGSTAEAARLLEAAAAAGHPQALANLGAMYANGDHFAQDLAKARQLYERSARARLARGAASLGAMLYEGEGGPTDRVRGAALIELASEAGDRAAAGWLREIDLAGRSAIDVQKRAWTQRYGRLYVTPLMPGAVGCLDGSFVFKD
jgi:TPR repeat protein